MPDTAFENELVAGARLLVSRRGYEHHGTYSGDGRVIHYAGRVRYPQGRIEEISLQNFDGNRPVYICRAPDRPRAEDIVRRARSKRGECRYDLFNTDSPGQRWRRFLSLVSLIKSDGALAASTASLTRRWSS
jgi:hypothetical protein